jgi:arabinofuranan 3-O-arabinosyltransferase
VQVLDRNAYRVEVHGATQPFWLVLGQSRSDGWQATLAGRDLGPSTLVDGFANGWLVDPGRTGADFVVTLRWTPQRVVWLALGVSGLGFLAVVAVAIAASATRRRTRLVATARPAEVSLVGLQGRAPGRRLPPVTHAAVAAGLGALAFAVGGIVPAVVVLAASALALADARLRPVVAVPAVGGIGVVAVWYLTKQWRDAFAPGVEWPDAFDPAHVIVLTAVLLLGADVAVGAARRRWGRRR